MMAGGSSVIVCAFTILLALPCGADRLLHRQRTFESTMMQDITMLSSQVLKIQENMETLTQMVNASLQTNGQAPGGSYTGIKDIERKLSRTTRQLHAAFANQKMAMSNELARMGETFSSTQTELKEQVAGIQKKVLTSEIRMQKIEEKILSKLDNYTKAVGEHLANLTEGYSNSIETQMDDVLVQIHNHTVNVVTQLQDVASATTQDRTMQLVEEISDQSETTDKRVAVFQQTTSDLLEGIAKQSKTTNEKVANVETVLQKTSSDLLLAMNKLKSITSIEIRLANATTARNGRIEVMHDGQWGTVCDDKFKENNNAATVVCRMLGYTVGVPTNKYGPGVGPILIDGVQCTGKENTILECTRNGFGAHNCGHDEDVGVNCS